MLRLYHVHTSFTALQSHLAPHACTVCVCVVPQEMLRVRWDTIEQPGDDSGYVTVLRKVGCSGGRGRGGNGGGCEQSDRHSTA